MKITLSMLAGLLITISATSVANAQGTTAPSGIECAADATPDRITVRVNLARGQNSVEVLQTVNRRNQLAPLQNGVVAEIIREDNFTLDPSGRAMVRNMLNPSTLVSMVIVRSTAPTVPVISYAMSRSGNVQNRAFVWTNGQQYNNDVTCRFVFGIRL